MKKLLLLLTFLPLFMFSYSQIARFQLVDNYSVVLGDSTFDLSVSDNVVWNVVVDWTTLTDSSGSTDTLNSTLQIQMTSNAGATYENYAGMTAATMSSTTGSQAFEDYMFTGDKLRLKFVKNQILAGTFDVWITYKIRQ